MIQERERAVRTVTLARCTGCGKITTGKVHGCWTRRDEWGQGIGDHYEPTELVDFVEVPGSARPNDG